MVVQPFNISLIN